MKTFAQLEKIGIVGMYRNNNNLMLITKDSVVWLYLPLSQQFQVYGEL